MKTHIIIIGAGVTGLVCARLALHMGHAVTLIAHHTAKATTSGMSAGMVAPALEALNDKDSATVFARLKAAQHLWQEDVALWPESICAAMATPTPSHFVWPEDDETGYQARFLAMGAETSPLSSPASGFRGLVVKGEWLFPASMALEALLVDVKAAGAALIVGDVVTIVGATVALDNGLTLTGDTLFLAGGYLSDALRNTIATLNDLIPIKGHVLQLPRCADEGVLRAPFGYLASLGETSVFGATMQVGQGDFEIEADIVESLKTKARLLGVPQSALAQAIPKVGVRAAFADGWPKFQWASDHLFIAAGMRRNGFVFAPLAAKTFLQGL